MQKFPERPVRRLYRVELLFLGAFLLVALALLYWSSVRGPVLLAREDNPRLVEAERRIRRGRIVDRDGVVLAESAGPTGAPLTRLYPQPDAAPVVGYYSVRFGTSGIEEGYDAVLRGTPDTPLEAFVEQTLQLEQQGRNVRLALDAGLQRQAELLLGDYQGAVLLLETANAAPGRAYVRALASHPLYDPNLLDETFETLAADASAPLLNRATQGEYQPGLLVQPFVVAAGLNTGLVELSDEVPHPNRAVAVDGTVTQCHTPPPEPATWADVLRHRCPGPVQDLGQQLGLPALQETFNAFGLTRDPVLAVATETLPDEPLRSAELAAIGQDNLAVTPLQIGLAWTALTGAGIVPQPQLVTDVAAADDEWQPVVEPLPPAPDGVAPAAGPRLGQALTAEPGLQEHAVRVISGPEGSMNAWYLGRAESAGATYVAVVVLEGEREWPAAQELGRTLLDAAGD